MKSSRRGVVLLMSLMVFAVVTTLSIQVLSHMAQTVSIVSTAQTSVAARQQLLAGEAWAAAWLAQQHKALISPLAEDLDRPWHIAHKALSVSGARVQIDIVDRQSCINLNELAVPSERQRVTDRLSRLSSALALTDEWVYWVQDWVDDDQALSAAFSHEDEYYAGLSPAYRTADVPIADVSELHLLPVLEQTWRILAPYVCALPYNSGINVNRLTPPLVQAYLPMLSASEQHAFSARIASSGFANVDALLHWPILSQQGLRARDWRVDSSIVEALITLEGESQRRFLRTLIRFDEHTGLVVPLSRAFSTFDVLSKALINESIRLPNK